MAKIIIGIIAQMNQSATCSIIDNQIKQAIFENGGIAIGIIAPVPRTSKTDLTPKEKAYLIEQIQLCNGLIFQSNESSFYETWIAKYAYDHNIPTLGINHGQHILIKALGGSIFKLSEPNKHKQPAKLYTHSLIINPQSKFYKIIGQEKIMVNSNHTYTVGACPLLEKVAFCEDGLCEVIESKNKSFYLGVQFNPEILYAKEPSINRLFQSFLSNCHHTK